MESPRPSQDRANSYRSPQSRRRRITIWTLAAPAAAIILWVSFFMAVGSSCLFGTSCASTPTSRSDSSGDDSKNDLEKGARTKIKPGDSIGAIAARFDLTEDELKACNPLVDPQALQPGQFLMVSAIDCEEADKAETGANPDPLAGDTTTGAGTTAPDPSANGTAAADPSTQANREATSEQRTGD